LQNLHIQKGHLGLRKMMEHFTPFYYTPFLEKICRTIVNECKNCLATKENKCQYGLLGQIGPAEKPYEILHIDTVGGFGRYGSPKKYLHLAIDGFSRFVWALTSKTQ